jgi:hypothetical protein
MVKQIERRARLGSVAALVLAAACGSNTAATGTEVSPAGAPTAASTTAIIPPLAAAGPASAPAAAPSSALPPSAALPSGAAGAASASAPGATTSGIPATAESPAASAKRFPDACDERRGSWSKPCSTNLDPCNLKSGYPGDEYCLLPPPAGQGIQIHFGPKNYTDTAEVQKYVIKPGEEFNQYAIVNIPTTEQKWFSYMKLSMRPGSHHLINNLIMGHPSEGFIQPGGGCDGESQGSFPGTQNLIMESPPQGIPAPENEGLGRSLPGNSSICQNYHRYNTTDKPALSEIWYNIWFIDEKDITQKSSGVMVNAGPRTPIPAHSKQVLTTSTMVTGDARIISLFGHRHAATERFQAWVNDQPVYDSWDWVESRLFNYDSITQNPPISPAMMQDGATSGILQVKRGDKVRVQCDVNNMTDQALRFANELYTGEMCILFGSTVGVGIN